MLTLAHIFISFFFVLAAVKSSTIRFRHNLKANTSATRQFNNLTGCTFKVRPDDTLHSISKSMNVSMDFLSVLNPTTDLSNPVALHRARSINIPCPGSSYKTFNPLNIAGCFFLFTIDSAHPSMQSLLTSPPDSVPGPLTLTSIWVANYQALPYSDGATEAAKESVKTHVAVDLTAPGEWKINRTIFIPTCYHAGIILDMIPVTKPKAGCTIDLGKQEPPSSPSLTIEALAKSLRVSPDDLVARNKWKGAEGQLPSSTVSIPCPGP